MSQVIIRLASAVVIFHIFILLLLIIQNYNLFVKNLYNNKRLRMKRVLNGVEEFEESMGQIPDHLLLNILEPLIIYDSTKESGSEKLKSFLAGSY